MSKQITFQAIKQQEELMVCFVWEMLLPPMVELGSCLAVPHSDLLQMVSVPGRAFPAASPFTSPLLLFLF